MVAKAARHIVPGDKLETEAGKIVTVKEVTNGIYTRSKRIAWDGGDTTVPNDTFLVTH